MSADIGIIVNPHAGKDVRRLYAPAGHSPDTAKIGIVRRAALAALDAGATRVVVASDSARIAARAIDGVVGAEVLPSPGTGSALDTRRSAAAMADLGVACVIVLGGDGTCRDVAMSAPDLTMIPLSTGTNNVFPQLVDGTSAGTAAGMTAAHPELRRHISRSKLLTVEIRAANGDLIDTDVALVDVAVINGRHTGARAVTDPGSVRAVVAAVATPVSTGLSSIPGRLAPLADRSESAIVVQLDPLAPRRVRVPLVPGSHDTVGVAEVHELPPGSSVSFDGPAVLAYDGERERLMPDGDRAAITVARTGPYVVAIERVLHAAAEHHLFDSHHSATEMLSGG